MAFSCERSEIEPVDQPDAVEWGAVLTEAFTAGGPPEDLHPMMAEKLAARGLHCVEDLAFLLPLV